MEDNETTSTEVDRSPLALYLKEISQIKLLKPEEERQLFVKIKRSKSEDERDSLRKQMVEANLRLVVKIAREYEGLGVPLLDLINVGNIGLMKGVERYDLKKGAKLSTYSAWWIKQCMTKELSRNGRTIRIPVNAGDTIRALEKAQMRLRQKLDREASENELAFELKITTKRVRQLKSYIFKMVSLDQPVDNTPDAKSVDEHVADESVVLPSEEVVISNDLENLRKVYKELTPRELRIVKLRYGIGVANHWTLEETGELFGITRERTRQIQRIALRKLAAALEALKHNKKIRIPKHIDFKSADKFFRNRCALLSRAA